MSFCIIRLYSLSDAYDSVGYPLFYYLHGQGDVARLEPGLKDQRAVFWRDDCVVGRHDRLLDLCGVSIGLEESLAADQPLDVEHLREKIRVPLLLRQRLRVASFVHDLLARYFGGEVALEGAADGVCTDGSVGAHRGVAGLRTQGSTHAAQTWEERRPGFLLQAEALQLSIVRSGGVTLEERRRQDGGAP